MDAEVEDIGTILRKQRHKLGHSLEEVAECTRIRKTYLESLEGNCFADLPGHAYVTGFIRVYAQFLQLNAVPLLEQLAVADEVANFPKLKAPTASKYQTSIVGRRANGGWAAFALGFSVVLLIGGAIYFLPAYLFPAKIVEPPSVVLTPAAIAEPAQEGGSEVNNNPNEPPPDSLVPEPVVAASSPKPEVLPAIKPSGSLMRMLALKEGSLTLHLDERKAHRYKLFNGLDLTWKVKNMVAVEMEEPGAARFWLDDQELDLAELTLFRLHREDGE